MRLRFDEDAAAEEESEFVVVVRLVFAVEGFWVEFAWRVSLESLDWWGVLGVGVGFVVVVVVIFVVVIVGLGALEKSMSEESELESVLVSEDDGDAFTAIGAVGGIGGSAVEESGVDDEVSGVVEVAFGFAADDLETLSLGSSSEEVSSDEASDLDMVAAFAGF